MVRGSSSPVPKLPGCRVGSGGDGASTSGRLHLRQKCAPGRVGVPQWGQGGPAGGLGAVRGVQQMGQKREVTFTSAPQWGQVDCASGAMTNSPHCLQKCAPGRSLAPQCEHVGVTAVGNAHRHCRQKCASGRLLVPHCGQMLTFLHSRVITAYRQPGQSGRWICP